MTKLVLAAALLALAAPLALADGIQGQTFTSDQHGVKLTAPAGWTLAEGKKEEFTASLLELSAKDGMLSGQLTAEENADGTLLSIADMEESVAKDGAKSFKREKDEKPAKAKGEWLWRQFAYENANGLKMFCVSIFAKDGAKVLALRLASAEALSKEDEALVKGLVDGFELVGAGAAPAAAAAGGPSAHGTGGHGAGGEAGSHPWAAYAVGSFVEFKIVSEMAGNETEMVQKQTLTSKTADELTLKMEGKMVKPQAMDMPPTEQKMPAKSPAGGAPGGGGAGGAANVKELGKGDEEIAVGPKKLKCSWVDTEVDSAGVKMRTRTWSCPDVPGGMVKTDSRSDTMKSTMTLVGFEAKK